MKSTTNSWICSSSNSTTTIIIITLIFCYLLCASHAARLHHHHHHHQHHQHQHHQHQHHQHHHQQQQHHHHEPGLQERDSRTTQEETEPSHAPLRHLSGEVEAIKREILERLGLEEPPMVPDASRGGPLQARLEQEQQEEEAWARYREMVARRAGSGSGVTGGGGGGDPESNPTTFTLTAHTGSPVMTSSSSSPPRSLRLHFSLEEVLAACSRHRLRVMSAHLALTSTLTQALAPASTLTLIHASGDASTTAPSTGSPDSEPRARLSLGVRLQRGVRSRHQASVDVSVALRGVIEKWLGDSSSSSTDNSSSSSNRSSEINISNSSGSSDIISGNINTTSTLAVDISLPSSPTAGETSPKSWASGVVLRVTLRARGPRRSTARRRSRRDASPEDCADSEQKKCCRSPMRVSFADIGWDDWVKAPAEYAAYACQGACPHRYKAANRYALLLAKMHRLTGGAVAGPCCVPAALEPLVLLHYDSDGKLAVSAVEDMIVSKCHCQ
ncbi:uncharacterized protein LOC116952001 [Petromyzon marinus]|uniref:Univin-like n=1 Tax=Petromyzon marinus TaxID=7757 RepID=A0AAJ7TZ21_PETMA|nr:univin-like [Petromyzon marinus]